MRTGRRWCIVRNVEYSLENCISLRCLLVALAFFAVRGHDFNVFINEAEGVCSVEYENTWWCNVAYKKMVDLFFVFNGYYLRWGRRGAVVETSSVSYHQSSFLAFISRLSSFTRVHLSFFLLGNNNSFEYEIIIIPVRVAHLCLICDMSTKWSITIAFYLLPYETKCWI